ncbi:tetratricopeptide repeat-containing sensor histidine kinase [Parapedobacter soli]|uniref:tetratricopeptide repeat-containing sensor histidine kinase n=1 Tax=Parapedobacter soli TaxID=416955 RepID=UPI0021C91B18|nr:sensor histidine kinase [Parapedobacter soli]
MTRLIVLRISLLVCISFLLSATEVMSLQRDVGNDGISDTIQWFLDLAWEHTELNSDSALYYANEALVLAKSYNDPLGEAKSLEAKGLYYEIVQGSIDMATRTYLAAVKLCEKYKLPYMAELFHTLGVLFHTNDNYEKAAHYYGIAYKLALANSMMLLQKKCLINLGAVNSSLGDFGQAENFLTRSLTLGVGRELDYDSYANLGNLHIRNKRYQEAVPLLEKATERHPDNSESEVNLRFLIDAKTALEDTTGMAAIVERATRSLETSNPIREKSLMAMTISNYYRVIGDYERALGFRDRYLALYEEIKENQRDEIVYELEARYQNEKNKVLIERKERQKRQILAVAMIIALSLVTLAVFYRKRLVYQQTIAAQQEELRQQQIIELKHKNRLLAMTSMIEGQEAERMRIAKDLHDGLGGLLSSVKSLFSTFQATIVSPEDLPRYDKTNQLIDEACNEVRRISHNMMPHALSLSGLEGALVDLGEGLRQTGIAVTLEISAIPKPLAETRSVMIYRIVQELLANIRKHADAKHVLLQLIAYPESIILTIEDDGKGFDVGKANQASGLGLKSLQSRVDFLKGSLHIDSRIGSGTTVTIEIPII